VETLRVGNDSNGRTAIVLVHGLFSSSRTWASILKLMGTDPEMQPFDVLTFEYSSPVVRFSRLKRIPDYNVLADNLGTFLEVDVAKYESLILVTHSQGGLIVQRYLARMLSAARGEELSRIRRIILFACPNSGSEIFLLLRKASAFWSNAQERELRPLNDAVLESQRTVLSRVVHASGVTRDECRIDIRSFAGETDNIVTPASARGVFPHCGVVPGDHFSIIQPDSHSHRTYTTLQAAILSSPGERLRLEQDQIQGGAQTVVSSEASALMNAIGLRPVAAGDAVCLSFSSRAVESFDLRLTELNWIDGEQPMRSALAQYLEGAGNWDEDVLEALHRALPKDRDREEGECKLDLLNLVRSSPEHGQPLAMDLCTAPWWVEREFNRALLRVEAGATSNSVRRRLLNSLLTNDNDAGTHAYRFPSSLYVEVALVDDEGYVLALEKDPAKGSHMAQRGRRWTASIEEGAKYSDVADGKLDPHVVALRGLQEELGIGPSEVAALDFHAVAISCSNLNTAVLGVMKVSRSIESVARRANRREYPDFVGGRCLAPDDVKGILAGVLSDEYAPSPQWHSTAHLRLLLTTLGARPPL